MNIFDYLFGWNPRHSERQDMLMPLTQKNCRHRWREAPHLEECEFCGADRPSVPQVAVQK